MSAPMNPANYFRGKIDPVHKEKVAFKQGENGKDRLRKNAVRFANRFHNELRTVSADIDGEYYGVVTFPVYGEAGLKMLERLKDHALRLYGRNDFVSLVKAFYKVMSQTEIISTAAVEYDIQGGRGCAEKIEKTWETAI